METAADTTMTTETKRALDEAIANSRVRFVGEPGPFFEDFAKAQSEFEAVKKNADVNTGTYGYSYAPLENLLAATRPALNRHGLSLLQPMAGKANGTGHELQTWIAHRSGARLVMETDIPRTDKIQALGSSITYLRRYTVQSVLGINGEDDDDGNAADGNSPDIKKRGPASTRAPQPSAAPPRPAPNAEAPAQAPLASVPAAPTAEAPRMTAEQSDEIARLFKAARIAKPEAGRMVKEVTGKGGPFEMTVEDAAKLIAHLKGLDAEPPAA
jgi:hypothetical protein